MTTFQEAVGKDIRFDAYNLAEPDHLFRNLEGRLLAVTDSAITVRMRHTGTIKVIDMDRVSRASLVPPPKPLSANPAKPREVMIGYFEGWNFSFWGGSPKWTLTCGHCHHTWRQRIPLVDEPRLLCAACGTLNIVPVTVN